MRQTRLRAATAATAGLLILAAVALTGSPASADTNDMIHASFPSGPTTIPAHASSSRAIDVAVNGDRPQVNATITFDFSGLAGVATASLPASDGCTVTGSTVICPITVNPDESQDLADFAVTVTSVAGAANGASGTFLAKAAGDNDIKFPDAGSTNQITVSDAVEFDTDGQVPNQQVNPGDAASSPLTFANLGSQAAPGVQIVFAVTHGFVPPTFDNCLYAPWNEENGTYVACTVHGTIPANEQLKVHGGFNGTIAADSATIARIDTYLYATAATTPTSPPANLFPGLTFAARPASGHNLTLDAEPIDGTIPGGGFAGTTSVFQVNTTNDIVALGANVVGHVGETVNATFGFKDNGPATLDSIGAGETVEFFTVTVPTWATAVTVPTNCHGANSVGVGGGSNAPGFRYYLCAAASTVDAMSVGETYSATLGLQITATSGTDGNVAAYYDGTTRNDPNTANNNAPVTFTSDGTITGNGDTFTPLTPARILDTRTGNGAPKARLGAGQTIKVQVAGVGGVPATGVTAVVMNVTGVSASANTYLTVFPDGHAFPTSSSLNVAAGQTLPNLVTVPLVNGMIDINNAAGNIDVLSDVTGYFTAASTGSELNTVSPARIVDTRSGNGEPKAPMASGATVTIQVDGVGGVPSSGVTAVVLNVTAVKPTAAGYLTVYPDGQALPNVSNLNFAKDTTVANLVIVPVVNGKVDVHNVGGSVDLLADVTGYFGATGAGFHTAGPLRIMDTRTGTGGVAQAPVGPNATVSLQVDGVDGIPVSGVTAVVLNVTVTGPTLDSYLTVYPDGQSLPVASNLNFSKGQTIANQVVVPVVNGKIDFHNANGSTQVVADLAGYFTS